MSRLQTFPPEVEIVGSYSSVQRQLGNAVPSLLAEVLAREIMDQFFGLPAKSHEPILTCPPARMPPSPPEPVRPVPERFHALIGRHAAHPGTGKGSRAARWVASEKSLDLAT